jgi:uncharacterized YigZ family protein
MSILVLPALISSSKISLSNYIKIYYLLIDYFLIIILTFKMFWGNKVYKLQKNIIKECVMVSVSEIFTDSVEIKGSKFISFCMPMPLYEEQMQYLRAHHPKAVHFVSAFRYLNEFDQIVEYAGDDGEPKGTSGKPTLSVLQGHDLVNAAIITVRYFGGTKLGPGGLVRAYAEAANAAYSQAVLYPYEKLFVQKIECNYPHISMIEYESVQQSIKIVSKNFGEKGALFEVEGTEENLAQFYNALGRTIRRE